jgi:hypothetical protein
MSSQAFCSQCGAPLGEAAKFCGQCGHALGDPADAASPGVGAAVDLVWQADMTLLNNRFFLADLVKWLGWTLLVCLAIFIPLMGIPGGAQGVRAAFLFTGTGAVLLIFSTLLFVLIMGNRVPMEFTLDNDGIQMRTVSKRIKKINLVAILFGVLARKPGAIGAGALGMSGQSTRIAWNELRKIQFHPVQRVIFLKGGILSRIRLYCTAQNYQACAAMVGERGLQQTPPPRILT